jgi:hypothetical protein
MRLGTRQGGVGVERGVGVGVCVRVLGRENTLALHSHARAEAETRRQGDEPTQAPAGTDRLTPRADQGQAGSEQNTHAHARR